MAIKALYPAISPSLLLDFANVKALDPRITFTRTTTATYYDGVTTAKAEENLLLQSQALATSPWFNNAQGSGNTVTNNASTAPDGTSTATSLTFGSTQFAARNQNVTTISGLNYTFSFWAKRVSGNTALSILHFDSATGASTAFTITNDWARYSVTVLGKSGGGNVSFGVQDGNASGFGEILLWGAQLEQRSAVTAYTPTTTQPITNYIPVLLTAAAGVARFDHNPTTGESLGLLVEEQRTNICLYSQQFDDAFWVLQNISGSASKGASNIIVAPDGTLTGDEFIAAGTSSPVVYDGLASSNLSVANNSNAYTTSYYVKAGTVTSIRIRLRFFGGTTADGSVFFNLSTGAIISQESGRTGTITPVGNSWYRLTVTGSNNSTGNTIVQTYVFSNQQTGNFYIWGAQLEAGAFPTSYIPTVASTVTRNADAASMTGTNFSSWFNAGEGALYTEAVFRVSGVIQGETSVVTLIDSSAGFDNQIRINRQSNNEGRLRFRSFASDRSVLIAGSSLTGTAKFCAAYEDGSQGFSVNGSVATTGTGTPVPYNIENLFIGRLVAASTSGILNGTIRKIAFYPQRISDAQLQALTS